MRKIIFIYILTLVWLSASFQPTIAQPSETNEMEKLSGILDKAMHYRFTQIDSDYDFETDPVMQEIWALRGEELRYYLDFNEVFNVVRSEFFAPVSLTKEGSPDLKQLAEQRSVAEVLSLKRQHELAQLAQQEVFGLSGNTDGLPDVLGDVEEAFFDALQEQLDAVQKGTGDQYFSDAYLNYRATIITLVEAYDYKLYTPIDQELHAIFSDAINPFATTSCGLYLMTSTIIIDYYMNTGQTGYFWFNAKPYGSSPCGYVVVYSTVGSKLDTQTPEAYCVTSQHGGQGSTLLARYPSGSSYVWFSENAVEFYCNTTGSAVQQGTLVD